MALVTKLKVQRNFEQKVQSETGRLACNLMRKDEETGVIGRSIDAETILLLEFSFPSVCLFVPIFNMHRTFVHTYVYDAIIITRPDRPKGAKDEVQQARRATN